MLCYGLIAWSFLLEMLGSVPTPTTGSSTPHCFSTQPSPRLGSERRVVATCSVLGALLAAAGTARFVRRDLPST
jgi:hypothetical protein